MNAEASLGSPHVQVLGNILLSRRGCRDLRMRHIQFAPRERHRQFRARVHIPKENIGHRVRSLASAVPRFQNSAPSPATAWSPPCPFPVPQSYADLPPPPFRSIDPGCLAGRGSPNPFLRSSTDAQTRWLHPISSQVPPRRPRLPRNQTARSRPEPWPSPLSAAKSGTIYAPATSRRDAPVDPPAPIPLQRSSPYRHACQ